MKCSPPTHRALAAAAALLAAATAGDAAVMTSTPAADTTLRRGSTQHYNNDVSLALKYQNDGTPEASGNDRIVLLKFTLPALAETVASATLRLHTAAAATNQLAAGHTLQLYGIMESLPGIADTQENFNPGTLTFANFIYTTGANTPRTKSSDDLTYNGIDDLRAPLLATYQVPAATSAGDIVTFSSIDLAAFVRQDTNGIASFIVATTTATPTTVPAFHSRESTSSLRPALELVTEPAAIPEPAAGATIAAGACLLLRRRRKAAAVLAVGSAAMLTAATSPPVVAQELPGQPVASFWHAADTHGRSILNWDPETDPNAPFNRSSVPLAPRIDSPYNLNPNARANQGGVTSLVAFNAPTNNYSQGSATQEVYAPTYWQYMDNIVFWGGSATSGSILTPNATIIDAAHRNGARALGNVFLAPVVYGGTMNEVNAFIQQRPDGSYPVADKMIQAARYYGFDGWFINQETSGGDNTTARQMQGFLQYMKQQAPDLHIQWYDAMNESGRVGWQGALNNNNDAFFDTTASSSTGRVSDSMFIDFRWQGSTSNLTNSAAHANSLGRSQYDLYAGVDFESQGSGIAGDIDRIFGEGGDHRLSLGIYRPEYTFNRSYKVDRNDFYRRDSEFWIGQNGDPTNTQTGQSWKGIANYVAAESVVKGETFVTSFNVGTGNRFHVAGEQYAAGDWNNLSLQDVLPTYRWMVDSLGSRLQPIISHTDAYYGGTSLLISGNLGATNDIRLYQAELAVAADTQFKIALKPTQADPMMKVAIAFTDAPESFVYLDVPAGLSTTDWSTIELDLGQFAGRTIANIGLRLGNDGPTVFNYGLRLGQFAIYRGVQDTPAAPTGVRIDQQLAVGKAGAASDTTPLPLRVHWNHAADQAYAYNLYRRGDDGSLQFLGATPNNAFFVVGVSREGSENFVTLELETMGLELGLSERATHSFYVDWSRPAWTLDWQAGAGGSGTWEAGNLNWRHGDSAPANQFWSNLRNDVARFSGAGGAVMVTAPVTAGGLHFDGSDYVLAGQPIQLTAGASINVASDQVATIHNSIAGSNGLNKTGDGTLRLVGAASYSGATQIHGGTLQLGAADVLPAGSALLIHDGATLDANGFEQAFASLSFAGDATLQMGESGQGGSVLAFGDTAGVSGLLTVLNWDGSPHGGGDDQLLFVSLPDAVSLAEHVVFVDPAGFSPGIYPARLLDLGSGIGEAVPVPEPAHAAGLAAAAGLILWRRTRRWKGNGGCGS